MRMSYKQGKDVKKKKSNFGMLSVKAGIDKNPNPTQADRIAGAKMGDRKKAMGGGMMRKTFKKSTKKSESNKERYKRVQKENTKAIGRMFKKTMEKK